MGKKLIGIAVIAIMLFGIFGLTACGNVSLDEYKAIKSQALKDYADAKGESNYSETDWAAICDAVMAGKHAIEAATNKPRVDAVFNDAKDAIDEVDEEENMSGFILTISVEKATITKGESIKVNVELKNESGQDESIRFQYLFWPTILGWNYFDPDGPAIDPIEPQTVLVKNGDSIKNIGFWGDKINCWEVDTKRLEKGTHILRFKAVFSVVDGQNFEVLSNRVTLVVQ